MAREQLLHGFESQRAGCAGDDHRSGHVLRAKDGVENKTTKFENKETEFERFYGGEIADSHFGETVAKRLLQGHGA